MTSHFTPSRLQIAQGKYITNTVGSPLSNADSEFARYTYHSAQGLFRVNICGPCTSCNGRDASACLSSDTIAYSYNRSIIVDGYQMLVHMDGPDGKHTVVKVLCEQNSKETKHDPNQVMYMCKPRGKSSKIDIHENFTPYT